MKQINTILKNMRCCRMLLSRAYNVVGFSSIRCRSHEC